MKPYILGYAMNPSLPTITEADVLRLTHLNLAFGLIKDGLLDMSQLTNISCIHQFRKWNPDLKIVLSVGGWGAGGFSTMAMTEEGRTAFAASCLWNVLPQGFAKLAPSCHSDLSLNSSSSERLSLTIQVFSPSLHPQTLFHTM